MNMVKAAYGIADRYTPSAMVVEKRQDVLRDPMECGGGVCETNWMHRLLLKSKRRPMFEGRWSCSKECLQMMVMSALRREEEAPRGDLAQHRHRLPLGLTMLSRGMISREQLKDALEEQRRAGHGRIGEWLIRGGGVSQSMVTEGLSMQWGCSVFPISGFKAATMARVAPRALLQAAGVTPVHVHDGKRLYLAFKDGVDASVALAIQRMSGMRVESGLAEPDALRAAHEELLDAIFVPATIESVGSYKAMVGAITTHLRRREPVASRMVRVQGFCWLRLWFEDGALTNGRAMMPHSTVDVEDVLYTLGTRQ